LLTSSNGTRSEFSTFESLPATRYVALDPTVGFWAS
jgi:hypothetical protein